MLLPGISILELFRLDEKMGLMMSMALAFGISMAINVAVFESLLAVSSALGFLGPLTSAIPYAILVVSAGLLVVSLGTRRKLDFLKRPDKYESVVLLSMVFLAGFLILYFQKYPIFPETYSQDFLVHAQYVASVVNFGGLAPLSTVFYYGVHINLAYAYLLNGGDILEATRVGVSILIMLSPIVAYAAVNTLFHSARASLIAVLIYVGAGYTWFGGVLDAGLYSNFYGILASLVLVIAFEQLLTSGRRVGAWVVFVLAVIGAYFSHYSTIAIGVPLLAMPILMRFRERALFRRAAMGVAAFATPGVLGALAFPQLAASLLSVSYQLPPGVVVGETYLSAQLTAIPQLQYLVAVINQDISAVLIFALAVVGSAVALRKGVLAWIPLIWLLSLLVVSPSTTIAWRYSYLAAVPLTLLASLGLDRVASLYDQPKSVKVTKLRRKTTMDSGRLLTAGATLAVLLIIVSSSWTSRQLIDSASNTSDSSYTQSFVYNAILWMKDNISGPSNILSVSDSRFTYSSILGGPAVTYTELPDPAHVFNSTFDYVVTTNATTLSTPPGRNPFDIYRGIQGASLVYSNPDVQILKITRK